MAIFFAVVVTRVASHRPPGPNRELVVTVKRNEVRFVYLFSQFHYVIIVLGQYVVWRNETGGTTGRNTT